eukprot:TRINITY_DN9842_c0_g1_i1.p1 TRINITY_DN9842_c0_g1~~TRINITY_DN9842_c0_g1_i1.p1  ORF type:complete len:294 (-),score=68.43 TRINITY_DN9842_c0_g1_i1:100-981(-)
MAVDYRNGKGALPFVFLRHESGSEAEIYTLGATLTSWKAPSPNDASVKERIFLSSKTVFDGQTAFRGGIPIIFPIFGPSTDPNIPRHGFARGLNWTLKEAGLNGDKDATVFAILELSSDDGYTRQFWNHEFNLQLVVRLTKFDLRLQLVLENQNIADPISFQALFHTYYNVSDIANVSVHSLKGVSFTDKVANNTGKEDRESVTIDQEVDRVYHDAPHSVEIHDGTSKLLLVTDANLPDLVVWNPWVEKTLGLKDMEPTGFHNMICVEPGAVATPVVVDGGKTWKTYIKMSVL